LLWHDLFAEHTNHGSLHTIVPFDLAIWRVPIQAPIQILFILGDYTQFDQTLALSESVLVEYSAEWIAGYRLPDASFGS
jgi:hypothetical protein